MSTNDDLLGKADGAPSAEDAAKLIAGAPSTSPPPVDLNEALGLTEKELVEAGLMEAEPVVNWRPVGGQEVSLMLRAIAAGMERVSGVPITKDQVVGFLSAKGL